MGDECIFCKIVKGEVPSRKVYEDQNYLGILDIAPLNKGHVQLIPKKHYRWVWDVPDFGGYWEIAGKIARAQMKALGAPMVEFLTHGMDVPHAHIWIVPIYGSEAFIKSENRKVFSAEELDATAGIIRENV